MVIQGTGPQISAKDQKITLVSERIDRDKVTRPVKTLEMSQPRVGLRRGVALPVCARGPYGTMLFQAASPDLLGWRHLVYSLFTRS